LPEANKKIYFRLIEKRKNRRFRFILKMFDFSQYLGFLSFLSILTIGFWLMIFLLTFVIPYWLFGSLIEYLKERREKRKS
tara:strand:- start:485 stop:724 length:240 start_codon:yes stop_codon:yes gene_type:complete